MVEYTDKQLLAIGSRNSNLLISAAAGSGKTAVLVERIIRLIKDEKSPVDVDRLLIVTFTEAAAFEMRQRITNEITETLKENPLDEHLRRQVALLNKATISTIHAFCNDIIRKNFHLISIDPTYRIGDATEINLLQEEILNDIFEKEYEESDNTIFFELIEVFGDRFTDEKLKSLIHKIYKFSNNSITPDKWLYDAKNEFNNTNAPIEDLIFCIIAQNAIKRRLKAVITSAEKAKGICLLEGGPFKYLDGIESDIGLLKRLLDKCFDSYESLYNGFSEIAFVRLAAIRASDEISEDLKEEFKYIRDVEIKKEIENIKKKFFFKSPNEQLKDLHALYPYILKLTEIVKEFRKSYSEIKLEKNIVDFNDLEHFALKILSENADIVKEYQEKYVEIFIDEYQDSNDIQEAILKSVAKENNRFMVGDLKQSIYKFRRAKPEIFKEKYSTYSSTGENIKIDLSNNFRSRENIINGINFIFKQIMSLEVGDVAYSSDEQLNYSADYKDNQNNNYDNEIIILETGNKTDNEEIDEEIDNLNKTEKESNVIGKKILDLINPESSFKLYDKKENGFKAAEYKDIVILLRSLSNAETLIEELNKMGIPAYAETSTGYFQNIEVITILSLLRTIDNPKQDIPLASVLLSPIYALTADELCKIRKANPKDYLYNSLKTYMIDKTEDSSDETYIKLNNFIEDLNCFRQMSKFTPISKLISLVYSKTNYFNYIGAMANGYLRQSNLRTLEQYAIRFENTSLKGLFNFINYIEKLIERNTDLGSAKIVSENENVVRIMTIHKSKGLEFPIVILGFTGKKFNMQDEYQDIILHDELGFGPRYIDLKNRIKSNTIARYALSEKIHEENYSEELRVLYVALTRAKEKLIITGSVSDMSSQIKKWCNFLSLNDIKIPAQYILNSNKYIDLIMYAIMRHSDAVDINKDVGNCTPSKNKELFQDLSNWGIKTLNSQESYYFENSKLVSYHDDNDDSVERKETKDEYIDLISKKFQWEYLYQNDLHLPTKISISEIKRNYYSQNIASEIDDEIKYSIFDKPQFLKQEEELSFAEIGTAIHTVMEHLDFRKAYDNNHLEMLIDNLYERNILSEKERKVLPIKKILEFTKSSLFERIHASAFVKREIPFVMNISAKEAFLEDIYEGKILVHGIIDMFFEEEDDLILVDFKSDYVDSKNIEDFISKYKIQLSVYKKSIENSQKKQVKESLIYSFHLGSEIKVNL